MNVTLEYTVYIEISTDFAEGCESFFVEVHPSFPVIDEERKEIETVAVLLCALYKRCAHQTTRLPLK